MTLSRLPLLLCSASALLCACSPASNSDNTINSTSQTTTLPEAVVTPYMFDDFNYQDINSFNQHGWNVRTETGHPGIAGAHWSADGISFLPATDGAFNGIVRMASVTDGTSAGTRHTQFCHARKYREGTYAARVFFRDEPSRGPDGDEVIQTFYAISPLEAPMDPAYSETDFEYLPNGGWGHPATPAMWSTSWETFQLDPWTKVNEFTRQEGSYAGWHILLKTIHNNTIRYYVDDSLLAEHSAAVYPEVPMSINFNLWFMPKGADDSMGPIDSTEQREYQQDIDWVYFQPDVALSLKQVTDRVQQQRAQNIHFYDSVPAANPALPSPCGL